MPKEREAGTTESATAGGHSPVTVKREWCKACGICIEFCPKKIFDPDPEGYPRIARPEECTYCQICEQLCPDFALKVWRDKRAAKR